MDSAVPPIDDASAKPCSLTIELIESTFSIVFGLPPPKMPLILDVKLATALPKTDAIAIALMLHYSVLNNSKFKTKNNFNSEGNIEFLKMNRTFKSFDGNDLGIIKKKLLKMGILNRVSN